MSFDFVVGLIIGIVFTIILLVIMGMLYAAGNADDESDVFYQEHLKASISKREQEKMRQRNYEGGDLVDEWEKRNPPEERIIMHCESPGCNNELVHRQEMLWGKCDSCMYHGGAELHDEDGF